ncbi:MAG: DnaJ domain-containing protein [Bacteroidia bacterium]|nr:DnaJ domain-containing protein [Bacteroidia bacterium]
MKEYYERLFLQEGATHDEIKAAYRKLVKVFHPDKNNGENEFSNEFRLVKEAYDKLIDSPAINTSVHFENTDTSNAQSAEQSDKYIIPPNKKGVMDFAYTTIYDFSKPIKLGGFYYTTEGATFIKEMKGKSQRVEADGIFLLIKMTVENYYLGTHILKRDYFKLTDLEGRHYNCSEEVYDGMRISGLKSLDYEKKLHPNIPVSFYLGFEVPKEGEYFLKLWGDINKNVNVSVQAMKKLE